MKNILAAVDFSDVTDAVVETAYQLATLSNARVRVVHAAAPDPAFVGYGVGPINEIEFRQTALEAEQGKLNGIVKELQEKGIEAEAELPEGSVVETIVKQVEDHDIDMIVVGSHGHGALFNLVAGSVTQGLIHKAKIPVLVVPSQRN